MPVCLPTGATDTKTFIDVTMFGCGDWRSMPSVHFHVLCSIPPTVKNICGRLKALFYKQSEQANIAASFLEVGEGTRKIHRIIGEDMIR